MDLGRIGLILLKIAPLGMALFLRILSTSHRDKWKNLEPNSMTAERRSESQDFKEWSVFIRDWLESRNLLAGSSLYAALLFLWYLVDAHLSEQQMTLWVFLLYIGLIGAAVIALVLSIFYTERFYEGGDPHDYYGKYYDEDEDGPSPRAALLWPRVHTYLIDGSLIVAIVYVEISVRM